MESDTGKASKKKKSRVAVWKHLVFPCDKVYGQFQYLFSTLGLFFGFVNIDRESSFCYSTYRPELEGIYNPFYGQFRREVREAQRRSGITLEVWVATRERNFMGQGQAFWVAPPYSMPGRTPLTEECPGAQDSQLWTGSGGSGVPLLQDSTPAQGSPLHSD